MVNCIVEIQLKNRYSQLRFSVYSAHFSPETDHFHCSTHHGRSMNSVEDEIHYVTDCYFRNLLNVKSVNGNSDDLNIKLDKAENDGIFTQYHIIPRNAE